MLMVYAVGSRPGTATEPRFKLAAAEAMGRI
jgi:hypothetical protein